MKDDSIKKRIADRHYLERVAMISGPVMGIAKKVSAFLDEHKVPHATAGGMAVSVHGHPRMTADVDIGPCDREGLALVPARSRVGARFGYHESSAQRRLRRSRGASNGRARTRR